MKLKSFFLSLFAVVLFIIGIILQLALSSNIVFAEIEASIFGTQMTASGLNLSCPLIISSSESRMVTAVVTNTLDQPASPLMTAEISKAAGIQSLSETLALAPHETRIAQWTINNSDVIFSRLIFVNVIQGRDGDLDPHRAYCGILIFNLFNLTGNESLILIFISGIAFIIASGIFWMRLHQPLDDAADQTLKACGALAVVTTLAMLSALPRWWGLTLFLDAFALMMLGVIFTEFVLFPK